MGTNTLSVTLDPIEDPLATKYGYAGDNNRNATVFNNVLLRAYDRLAYAYAMLKDLFGAPLLISGVNAGSDKFTTAVPHGLPAGTLLRFKALNGAALPGGIDDEGAAWFLLADTSTTFKVSATSGGSPVDITDAGGGFLYVYKVPDLLNSLFTNSVGSVQGSLGNQLVTIAGGQTITGAKEITDLTWTGTSSPKVASRSVTRALSVVWVERSSKEAWNVDPYLQPGEVFTALIELPDEQTLTSITVTINPDDVGSLPGSPPTVDVSSLVISTGVEASIGAQAVDGSVDATAYSARHDIAVTGLSEVIAANTTIYRVSVSNPTSDPINIIGIRATCTVSSITAWN